MIYKSKDIAYRFILLFDIPSKKEYVYFVFDECRVQHETLCLDRPNYQDFRIIVLFVLKLIASTIDIYPLLPPYKASERKDHKTGYQQSKLSGIWAAFPNNCPYRIVMC